METQTLKPCPFCGNPKPRIINLKKFIPPDERQPGVEYGYVKCQKCGGKMYPYVRRGHLRKQTAIRLWNRRVQDV